MKKIIIVDSGIGRTGSSAMMGLLKIMDVNLGGNYSEFYKSNLLNKKGYFELKSIEEFLKENFSEMVANTTCPTIGYLNKRARYTKGKFLDLLDKEFGNKYPIGIKFGKGLLYGILNSHSEVYALVMRRKLEDQAASILKMWRSAGKGPHRKRLPLSKDLIINFCKKWNNCSAEIMSTYTNIKYISINFYTLIEHPFKVAQHIAEFAKIPCASKKEIEAWIEPKLVHKL